MPLVKGQQDQNFYNRFEYFVNCSETWNILTLTLVIASLHNVEETLVTKHLCVNKILEDTAY